MAALRSFNYLPMAGMGEVIGYGPPNTGAVLSPDFMHGPYAPPKAKGAYDEFGWNIHSGVFEGAHAKLTRLDDASVQRRSLGKDRWHIVLADGICARDSYHDGDWLGPHIGEAVGIEIEGEPVRVNLMDDVPIDGRCEDTAVLISHFWAPNYAHSLLETASRFWAFDTFDMLKDLPVVWDAVTPWQRALADILAKDRIAPLPANRTQFRELYVPSFHSQIGVSPQAVRWLRGKFDAPDGPGKKRIFVSRADATERRIVNENEVIDLLKPMGFETVMLTGMSVAEQRQLFGEAECVVMPHGAGCANMIFAGTGTKIIEFVPKSYQHHMFWHIAKWSGHWYARLISEDGANKDMRADLTALRRALEAGGL